MLNFVKQTPPGAAEWLRQQLRVRPSDPTLVALATDLRMAALWAELSDWQAAPLLVQLGFYYRQHHILSVLVQQPVDRIALAAPEYFLLDAAETFGLVMEVWPAEAGALLGEPVNTLISRVREFAEAARAQFEKERGFFDEIPAPKRRGRGNTEQLAYRTALANALNRLSGKLPRVSKERQDRIIAILTSVVFKTDVSRETIRQHRERQNQSAKKDNSVRDSC